MIDITRSGKTLLAASAIMLTISMAAGHAQRTSAANVVTTDQGPVLPARQDGDPQLGKQVFRFETFGNEGFWTDAVRLPAGIDAAKVTPMQALQLGLQIDMDAIDPATQAKLAEDLRRDPSGRTSALLNDPAVTLALVKANAVIGMAAKGDKVGTSCALCHTMTDAAVFKSPKGGSIGHRLDGLANNDLNLGAIFATAANTRALYTIAQTQLAANRGKTLGRAPRGLTGDSTEADFDAYFSNPRYYPIGMFDDTFDGNGDPMHNTPLFRQDLAAPYGSEGTIARLDNFSNLVYTSLFDQTMLTTPGGRAFVHKLAGPAGDELIATYVKILRDTNVTGYPYITARAHPRPGSEDAPIGVRVDQAKLLALNAYLAGLQAPRGANIDRATFDKGRAVFSSAGCAACHNVDQGRAVPTTIHFMSQIFPGDRPMMLAMRTPPLNPVLNTPASYFDDKMAVFNASIRGEKRGLAMPLLLDLARKPVFLHDNSVPSLLALFDPARGKMAPHPFYPRDRQQRAYLIAYLRGADTERR